MAHGIGCEKASEFDCSCICGGVHHKEYRLKFEYINNLVLDNLKLSGKLNNEIRNKIINDILFCIYKCSPDYRNQREEIEEFVKDFTNTLYFNVIDEIIKFNKKENNSTYQIDIIEKFSRNHFICSFIVEILKVLKGGEEAVKEAIELFLNYFLDSIAPPKSRLIEKLKIIIIKKVSEKITETIFRNKNLCEDILRVMGLVMCPKFDKHPKEKPNSDIIDYCLSPLVKKLSKEIIDNFSNIIKFLKERFDIRIKEKL